MYTYFRGYYASKLASNYVTMLMKISGIARVHTHKIIQLFKALPVENFC